MENAAGHEALCEGVIGAGIGVAAQLALSAFVAKLITPVDERHLRADVDAFLEAEVAAVAVRAAREILIVRSFEAVDACQDHHFLESRHTDANRVARLVVAPAY